MMNKITDIREKRYDEYGFLKLFMAFLIVICHYNILISNPINLLRKGDGFLYMFFSSLLKIGNDYGGRLPICFFVLSGHAMMRGYYSRIAQKRITLKSFLVKRLVRNLPLLWFSVIMMAAGQWIWFYYYSEYWTGRDSSLWSVLLSLTGLSVGTVVNTIDTVNGPIWYISVLLICYVIYWILTRIIGERLYAREGGGYPELFYCIPIAVGLAVLTYSIHMPFLTSHTAIGYVGFFWGTEIYLALERKSSMKKALTVFSAIGFCLVAFVFLAYRGRANLLLGNNSLWMAFLLITFPIIIIDRFKSTILCKNRLNDFLGRLSYPLFLIHIPSFMWVSLITRITLIDEYKAVLLIIIMCSSLSLIWILSEKRIQVALTKVIPLGEEQP